MAPSLAAAPRSTSLSPSMSLLLQPLQCAVRLLHAAKSTLALVPSDHVLLVTMATILILLASSTQLPIALCSNHFPPGLWNCSSLGSVSFSESSPAGPFSGTSSSGPTSESSRPCSLPSRSNVQISEGGDKTWGSSA